MADAAATGSSHTPAHLVKHVCFRLHGQELAVDIAAVKETLAMRPLTRVFLAPPHIAGIMNLRGDIVAVLDLARRLGLPPTTLTSSTRVVVCRYPRPLPAESAAVDAVPDALLPAEGLAAGILVDALTELRTLDMGHLEPPPPTLPEDTASLLRGVTTGAGGAPLQVLDVARLLEREHSRATRREAS
jgi:purine-binding chemotaxis protein CheW